jgi:hypothetical protein
MLLYRRLFFQRTWASCATLATKGSGEAEALPVVSSRSCTPTGGIEDNPESGCQRDSGEESWTRTSSSKSVGSAFFISRRQEQNDVISPQLRQTAFQLFQKSTLESGGTLDRRRYEVFEAVQRASSSSVWYTR